MAPRGSRPNILFLVWDACRLEHAREYASNLVEMGDSGVWFENAIAPATWSLPSHASLFTGKPPHEHGITQPSQSRVPADLVGELQSNGYSCYGVSGNGFASPLWEFDEPFDGFRSTQGPEPYVQGLDVYTPLRHEVNEGTSELTALRELGSDVFTHDHPVKSAVNLAAVGLNHVSREKFPVLQKVPHPIFRNSIEETYSPKKNTRSILNVVDREISTDGPFFVFSNYMDTHRPYDPPADLQEKHLGEILDDETIRRLNDEVAAPWEFIRRAEEGEIDDADVETLRKLYAGEVESVDRHLGRIVDELRRRDVLDDTLIVVTSDHGENLGEVDVQGNRRFGHEASLSDDLCRVPLVVSHPDLDTETMDELFSLTNVYEVIREASRDDSALSNEVLRDRCSRRVACEYPALGDESFFEKYPDIDRNITEQRVSRDCVAAYGDDWRVLVESDGTRYAEIGGKQAAIDDAPSSLLEFAENILERLEEVNQEDVNAATQSQLQDLGYL